MVNTVDTITAIATPAGRGGVGIVRISGPAAHSVAEKICGQTPAPKTHQLRPFKNTKGDLIDHGLVLSFAKPNSYTGEDVVELQGHGGPIVMQNLLDACLAAGARLANPGEFTERAYLNDRIDLAQAEAVADLIDATSQQSAQAAMATLQGEFSHRVHALVETITGLRTWIEAAIDFTDEDIDFLADSELQKRLDVAIDELKALLAAAGSGRVLREGLQVVILGEPNVGKSSLLNKLAGQEAAIVTDIPGTTRDVLNEHILLEGLELKITDTAGLRDSSDAVEREGIRRAKESAKLAELILLVIDDQTGITEHTQELLRGLSSELRLLPILNKADLTGGAVGLCETDLGAAIRLSANTGAGFSELTAHLHEIAGLRSAETSPILARQRHIDALNVAQQHLDIAVEKCRAEQAGELAAEELRLCQQALSTITGEFGSEDLLGEIFSNFCVGK